MSQVFHDFFIPYDSPIQIQHGYIRLRGELHTSQRRLLLCIAARIGCKGVVLSDTITVASLSSTLYPITLLWRADHSQWNDDLTWDITHKVLLKIHVCVQTLMMELCMALVYASYVTMLRK